MLKTIQARNLLKYVGNNYVCQARVFNRFLLAFFIGLCSCGCIQENKTVATGQLYVTTEPEGATLLCDNITQDVTPTTVVNLSPGEHLVTLRKRDYREARSTVIIKPNQRLALDVTLEPETGLLLISSDPPGAEVEIDSAHRGTTPLFVNDITLGKHRITFRKASHIQKSVDVTVADRIPIKITTALSSDTASLVCESDPRGAEVLVDGASRGKTPTQVKNLTSGSHKVEFTLPGYSSYSQDVIIHAGQNRKISAVLVANPATIEVVTRPEGARVYVNDQFRGLSPVSASNLAPGAYVIKTELKGYATISKTNAINAGQSTVVEFVMQKNSGTMILTTQPPGVTVFLDGENMGMTHAKSGGQISEPLQADFLATGQHSLQLVKQGFFDIERTITVSPSHPEIVHEKLKERPVPFVPDVSVTIKSSTGTSHTYTGMVRDKTPGGGIKLEINPGVFRTFEGKQIIHIEPIIQEPEGEDKGQSTGKQK